MTLIDKAIHATSIHCRRRFFRVRIAIALLVTSMTLPAFGAFSEFVVITPQNEAKHGFLIQSDPVAAHADRTRVRVIGQLNGYKQAWLIVCKQTKQAHQQNFRSIIWGEDDGQGSVVEKRRLNPGRMTLPDTGSQPHAFVEVTLPNEEMARSYLYIDSPSAMDDGGYYYSIDLAYYLDGPLGKKSEIYWEE